jgi:hypothetical protein
LQPAFTGKAIADGYFHWSAETAATKKLFEGTGLAQRFFCSAEDTIFANITDYTTMAKETQLNQDLIQELAKKDINTIIVHKDGAYYHPHCQNVRTRVGLLAPQFETLTSSQTQQKYEQPYRNTRVGVSFFVPQDGTFDLEGMYAYPETARDLSLQIATSSAQFEFSPDGRGGLTFNGFDENHQIRPNLRFPVKEGDVISFSSTNFVDDGLLTVWFSYKANPDAPTVTAQPVLKKIYEDKDKEVYQITI